MDTSMETSKKLPLEDLSQEELIKKCRGLLTILQKAKQSKDLLIEENSNLKKKLETQANATSDEVLQKLTQQKLDLVTALHLAENQRDAVNKKLKEYEINLANADEKLVESDTSIKGFQRQIKRLTEENEQLFSDLAVLEKQDKCITESEKELEVLKASNEELVNQNKLLTEENNNLLAKQNELLKNIGELKLSIKEKEQQNVNYVSSHDDLNTEVHKNKALVEKLQQDITTLQSKLSDNQIVSSGVTSDLQNANEKLKEKIKFFHSKIVKLAGDVKVIKEQKYTILENFKEYVKQVKVWESQLKQFSDLVLTQFEKVKLEKLHTENEREACRIQITVLEKEMDSLKICNSDLSSKLEQSKAQSENSQLQLDEELKILKDLHEKEKHGLQKEITELHDEKNILTKSIDEKYKTKLEELTHNNNSLQQRLDKLQEQNLYLEELKVKYDSIQTDNKRIINDLNKSEEEMQHCKTNMLHLTEQNSDLQSKADNNHEVILKLNETIEILNEELDSLKVKEKSTSETENEIIKLAENNKLLSETIASIKQKLEELTNENKSLSETKTLLEQKLQEIQNSTATETESWQNKLATLETQLSLLQKENGELLAEMNEMNQALKERGEMISKHQEYGNELVRNINTYEAEISKLKEVVSQKEEIITKLECDLGLLQNRSSQHSQSINEMHNTLVKKDEEISHLQNELTHLKEKLDTSQDASFSENDAMSTSTISRTEELSRIKDLEGSWEERYGKLRSLALKLKGKIRNLSSELTKEQSEKAELQQKLGINVKTVQSLQTQCDKIQDELDQTKKELKEQLKKLDAAALEISSNKKQLAENDELISKLKIDIDNLNKEKGTMENWKKQVSSKVQTLRKELDANNLLKKDYENQISKLTAQLEQKEKLLKEETEKHDSTKNLLHESHNECKKQSVLNLEMQDYERSLKDSAQKLDKKQEVIVKLKSQIESHKSTISNIKEQNRLLEDRIKDIEVELEGTKSEMQVYKKSLGDKEGLLIQKDDNIQDLTHSLENSRSENEDLSTQLSSVIAEHQKLYNSLKSERDYLYTQNVSLQQKLRDIQENLKIREDELKGVQTEYSNYKVRAQSVLRQNQTRDVSLEEKLTEEVASFKTQAAVLSSELSDLKVSADKLKEENTNIKADWEKVKLKQKQLKQDLGEKTKQYEVLSQENRKMIAEHADAIRNLKLQSETLAQCYRQQLSEQEVRHNQEIIELQSKIEKVAPAPEVPQLSPPSIPREQGEGSESIDTKQQFSIHPVPLDRLLNNEADQDIFFVRKQLMENEAKVVHLTALLADTEQDLAKHVQMNKLLKEEIRRQQRSVEREQHAENLEYLKNVIFKFVTLNSGDERFRLVPVLNTILKLSPEETNKLNMVAKGDASKGWTNYLPVWPSTGKPQ